MMGPTMAQREQDREHDDGFDLVDPHPDPSESAAESALRPTRLAEFDGQPRVSDQLGLVLEAARARDAVPDHVLLSGPPGLGKTTLAGIIATEMGARCGSPAGRPSNTPATWLRSCPG